MTSVFKEREGREDRNFFQKQETDFQQYCELKSKYQNWKKGIISSQYLLVTSDSIPKLFDKTIFVLLYLYLSFLFLPFSHLLSLNMVLSGC